jgi:hypothetical protein
MADFYGSLSSTSFHVKDREAFLADPDVQKIQGHALSLDGFFEEEDGTFAFGWHDQYPSTVLQLMDEDEDENGETPELDICEVVRKHIADGEICQIGISGNEKLRYIGGSLNWVSSKGTAYFDGQTCWQDVVTAKSLSERVTGLGKEINSL